MSNPKVFEFAKEVGMTPLALMEKIREWHLPVKSHMAELDLDTLAAIKAKLTGPVAGEMTDEKKADKKPAARKKVVAAPKAEVVKATKGKDSKMAAAPVKKEAVAAAPAPKGAAVVRRKKVEEVVAAPVVEEKIEAVEAAPEVEVEQVIEVPQKNEAPEVVVSVTKVAAASAPTASPTPVVPAPVVEVATPVATAPAAEEPKKPMVAVPARKKEVSIGNSGVASSPAKRNIVGRMDLSRVSSPHGQQQRSGPGGDRGPRPMGSGGSQAASGGFGANTANRGKGNLRAGFVQQAAPVPELFPVDPFGRKRDDRKRGDSKGPGTDSASAKPADEEQIKHFDAAEFRKREMVFQPKKKKGMLNRPSMQTQKTTPKASKRVIDVNQTMKVGDLAMAMGLKATELIKVLMKNGVMATVNQDLDFDTISLIVPEFGFEANNAFQTAEEILVETAFGDLEAEKVLRAPVVTIMGHVDHGKTSLLDAIRKANVAAGEAGGITQHIGAYRVTLEGGQQITFLDTPGHEAFTAMRARGANVTDIAIIVVAADDGAMPQTIEAISHAKAAGVPIIVAVNKMDKPGANPDKIKQQLTEQQLVPEEWGGETIYAPVSAHTKAGIKELLEQIMLVAEVADLKANPRRSGTGAVIESKLEKGRGAVATILVQDGTIRVSDYIVAGLQKGRIKSLTNDRGERVQEAGPGVPVEVLGLDGTPVAGDKFDIVEDEKAADHVIEVRRDVIRKAAAPQAKISLEDLFSKVTQGDVKELPLILKADVTGSMEAIIGMLNKASTPEVKIKIVHSAVGGVTESDVLLAQTAKGIVVGFNVRPDNGAQAAAKRTGVEIRSYTIVYEMMDEIKKAMGGLLSPDVVEELMGSAEVRNTFPVPKIGTIAGCFISSGKVQRNNLVRLVREGKIVYQGKISSLKRFKDDAKEVAQGFECGIGIENFNDLKVGDVIEAFIKKEVARDLDSPRVQA